MNRVIDLLLLASATIIIYYRYTLIKLPVPKNDIPYKISGQVLEVPKTFGNYQSFHLGQVYVTTRYPPEYTYGEMLTAYGVLTPQMTMRFPKITATDTKNQTDKLMHVHELVNFRSRLADLIGSYLPTPEAELVSGTLWGEKANLPKGFSSNLKRTGTIHMIVVSGYNIAVVAALLLGVFKVLGRRAAFLLTITGIAVYTLMTGAEAPSVRAAIMGGIAVLGQTLGRQQLSLRLLVIAAVIMLLINPLYIEDLGFQLSFMATLGIILFGNTRKPPVGAVQESPPLREHSDVPLLELVQKSTILQELRTTLAAQVLTLPILAASFGQVSLISPLANLLVGWTIPYLMAGGAILTPLAAMCPNQTCLIPSLVSTVITVPAKLFTTVVSVLGSLSWAAVDIKIGAGVVIGYYLIITAYLFLKNLNEKQKSPAKRGTFDDQ